MGLSIKGFAYSGKLEDLNDSTYERLQERFATIIPITSNRAALDTTAMGVHLVGAADRIAEVLSDEKQIVLTGHDAKVGDIIRLKTTANAILEVELPVRSIPDANTIELEGVLSAAITAADTFDILRPIPQRFDDTGASLASVVSPPIQFVLDGVDTTVNEDTGTPANNAPLPVKITSLSGDINITAGDLNVQLDHTGANPDSTRIGDGTTTWIFSAGGEGFVAGLTAANAADVSNPVKVGARFDTALPTYDDGDVTNLQADVNGRLLVADITISSTPGVFAEDSVFADTDIGSHLLSVRQDAISSSTSADGDYASLKSSSDGALYVNDLAARVSLASINGKLLGFELDSGAGSEIAQGVNLRLSASGGSIEAQGSQLSAASIPVVIASDQGAVAISAAALPLPSGAATEVTLATLGTQVTSAAILVTTTSIDGKLGSHDIDTGGGTEDRQGVNLRISASGGSIEAKGIQVSASSIPVVLASDSVIPNPSGRGPFQFIRNDYTGTNVTTGAFVELTASLTAASDTCEIFDSSGQTLEIAVGGAGSEVVQFRVFPGGNGLIPLDPATFVAAARITIRAVSALADVGEININFYN